MVCCSAEESAQESGGEARGRIEVLAFEASLSWDVNSYEMDAAAGELVMVAENEFSPDRSCFITCSMRRSRHNLWS